jgi:O-antigen/teichoic acid export membrane protein
MYFVTGYVWVFSVSSMLALIGREEVKTVLTLNLLLQSFYFISFLRVFTQKKREIIIPALSLVTLQVFTFLTVLFVFMAKNWSVKPVLWALVVFFITLFIQILEQSRYLKRLDKP